MGRLLGLFLVTLQLLLSAEEGSLRIVSPTPNQVLQRNPATVQGNPGTGGYRAGSASVTLVLSQPLACEWRLVTLEKAFGKGTEWVASASSTNTHLIVLPAGGWYRLAVRTPGNSLTAKVEPIGVGEVFIVAGQSYGENCNDEKLKVEDAQGRVVAFHLQRKTWAVAHDPQPNISSKYANGSIWPTCGDALLKSLQVPIGFVNVACAGTASKQWMPGQQLYRNLVLAAQTLGSFRAVLWQQGESDVMAGTTKETYVANLIAIRSGVVKECGFQFPWLTAKTTIHPTVYTNPKQETVIRLANDTLWKTPGFRPGPDTDTLTGENRGGAGSQQHFTGIGQRRAGQMWAQAVQNLITSQTTEKQ